MSPILTFNILYCILHNHKTLSSWQNGISVLINNYYKFNVDLPRPKILKWDKYSQNKVTNIVLLNVKTKWFKTDFGWINFIVYLFSQPTCIAFFKKNYSKAFYIFSLSSRRSGTGYNILPCWGRTWSFCQYIYFVIFEWLSKICLEIVCCQF